MEMGHFSMALVTPLAGSQPNVADKAHDDIEDGYLKNVNAKRIWSKHCELRNKRDGPDTKPLHEDSVLAVPLNVMLSYFLEVRLMPMLLNSWSVKR